MDVVVSQDYLRMAGVVRDRPNYVVNECWSG